MWLSFDCSWSVELSTCIFSDTFFLFFISLVTCSTAWMTGFLHVVFRLLSCWSKTAWLWQAVSRQGVHAGLHVTAILERFSSPLLDFLFSPLRHALWMCSVTAGFQFKDPWSGSVINQASGTWCLLLIMGQSPLLGEGRLVFTNERMSREHWLVCVIIMGFVSFAATAGGGGSEAPRTRATNLSTAERGQAPQPGPDHLRWKPGQ